MKDEKKQNVDAADKEVIDLRVVFRTLWSKKWLFVKVWVVTFVLSCVYILPQPRRYVSGLTLAPETGGATTGGTLSSLASSFGFDLGSVQSEDAFYPELYPDVMSTNEFLIDMLYVKVKTLEGDLETTYLDYLTNHQKKNPLGYPYSWCKRKLRELLDDKPEPISLEKRLNPRFLSKSEDDLVNIVRDNIACDVDIKTNVISITVSDQDPLICTTIADSARVRLQEFITSYRTSKVRSDLEYYKKLVETADAEYKDAVKAYSRYCDSHQNVIMQVYASERDELENVMATKLSTLNAMQTQYEAAKAKVQERTPAFTVLKSASVPVKADKPKRMVFVATMLFLAAIGTCLWIFRKSVTAHLLGAADKKTEENV